MAAASLRSPDSSWEYSLLARITAPRLDEIEKRLADHETRLRDASTGVTQFRFWSTMSSGGSALMSLAALIRSYFA